MTKRVDKAVKDRAKALFLQGWSFRDIAAEVLPTSSGGHITVFRWAKNEGWREEKVDLERQEQEAQHQKYLDVVAEIKERHLRIAQKAAQAAELAIEAFFEKDEVGNITGIKLNRWGLPAIPAVALVQLINVATELERKTVGMDQLEVVDDEKTALPENVVDADVARAFGDWLAQQALLAPAPVDAEKSDNLALSADEDSEDAATD